MLFINVLVTGIDRVPLTVLYRGTESRKTNIGVQRAGKQMFGWLIATPKMAPLITNSKLGHVIPLNWVTLTVKDVLGDCLGIYHMTDTLYSLNPCQGLQEDSPSGTFTGTTRANHHQTVT
eukprot:sb/3476155/